MVHFYKESVIIQNVPTNIPDGQPGGGKPSDHPIVYCQPRLETGSKSARQVVVKKKIDQTENARVKMKAFDVSTGGKQLILKFGPISRCILVSEDTS